MAVEARDEEVCLALYEKVGRGSGRWRLVFSGAGGLRSTGILKSFSPSRIQLVRFRISGMITSGFFALMSSTYLALAATPSSRVWFSSCIIRIASRFSSRAWRPLGPLRCITA
jgi:hypothetical protein